MSSWLTTRYRIDLRRARVMGIVNVTPDSFADGGAHAHAEAAIAHCERLCEQGADILDVGGESTRPGARPTTPAEERERVLPVLRHALRLGVAVSLDTRRVALMREALDLGVDIINDINALRGEGAEELLASHARAGVCLMHMQGEPTSMQDAPSYGDVAGEVMQFLLARANRLRSLGIDAGRIVVDPGFGFGKTLAHNIELHRHIPRLCQLGISGTGWLVTQECAGHNHRSPGASAPSGQRGGGTGGSATRGARRAGSRRGRHGRCAQDLAGAGRRGRPAGLNLDSTTKTSMTRRYFGTDGIRGTVGMTPITADFMLRLGHAVGSVLRREVDRPTVIIGKDTRISGYMIESALEAGFASAGVDVLLSGPLPTPGVAYLTRALRLDLGVVISASHNPFADNGIKFFSARGEKLPDEWELAVEAALDEPPRWVDAAGLGRARRLDDARGRYIEFCKSTVAHRAVAQGPEARRRRGPRRGLSRRARCLSRTRCRRRQHRLQPRRAQHQPGCRCHRAGSAGASACATKAPTTASRSTATPTGC